MSLADLQRLIGRATPRWEDVRSPDRTDFVRREHGHLPFREVIDALDALEFSVDTFIAQVRELPYTTMEKETAVHGLNRVLIGVALCGGTQSAPTVEELAVEEALPDVEAGSASSVEAMEKERAAGGECFQKKDYAGAVTHYGLAIRLAPEGHDKLPALYSNRSAALMQAGQEGAALADALRCTALAPSWPKGHFRSGTCLRQLRSFDAARCAFQRGAKLEPANQDWVREVERTDRAQRESPEAMVRQLVLNFLPEIVRAWTRGAGVPDEAEAKSGNGVLQLQVSGELKDFGAPKWQLLQDKREPAKGQIRFAFQSQEGYLANLAANLQSPADGVGVKDLWGKPLKIAEIGSFLQPMKQSHAAAVHIDIKVNGQAVALLLRVPCDASIVPYLPKHADPPPPQVDLQGVLQLQRSSGFAKILPQLLGFQSFPGDLNFPVIDLARDAPQGAS